MMPTAIVEYQNVIYIPSNSELVVATNRTDGALLWKYKISNSLITSITPVSKNKVIARTMDGKATCLQY